MASAHSSSSRSSSQDSNIMWEQGDDYTDFEHNSSPSHSEIQSPLSSTPISPISSQPTTPGITTPLSTLGLSSQSSTFFPESSITKSSNKGGRPKRHSHSMATDTHLYLLNLHNLIRQSNILLANANNPR